MDSRGMRLMVVTVLLFVGMLVVFSFGSSSANQINAKNKAAIEQLKR